MNYLAVLYTIVGIHFLITVSPGPNFLISAKFGLCAKRIHGFYVTAGIATGALFHILISLFGLSDQIVSVIPPDYLKILGSIYFVYLGIKLFFSKNMISKEKRVNSCLFQMVSSIKAYRIGFFTMLFNPKSAIHFVIVFSSMMDVATPLIDKLIICILLPLITFSWHSTVMLSFSIATVKGLYNKFFKIIDPVFGSLLILIAYKTITSIKYECIEDKCSYIISLIMN